MLTNAMPKMRLLLIKSDVKNPGKYKHSGNHYLLNGRWHAIHKDKPVPKGAAVAAHPHAAGAPVPGKVQITDEQWEQLKLPADNSNASTFNKQLDQLKAAAMAGDVTGILGSGFGTNTYSKKLVGIANKVLGFMGSTHAVTPGQKPGAHPAVQTAPEIEAGVAAPVNTDDGAPKPADPFPTFADHDKADAASGLSMPAFDGGTVGQSVIDYYQPIAQKVMDLAAAGDVAGLEAMKTKGLEPNGKGKVGNTWKGKTPNSKLLLDLHAKALAHASGSKPTESKPADLPSAGTVTEPAASTGATGVKEKAAAAGALVAEGSGGTVGESDLFSQAKAAGVKGIRVNMSEDALKAKIKSHLSGERAVRYIREGKKSGLPQYAAVSEVAARKFAETVSQHPHLIDTRNWIFDARGVPGFEELVSGGLLAEGDARYKHKLTSAGKELAHQVIASPSENVIQGPKEGDRNADGLVFRGGRWHRDDQNPVKNEDRAATTVSAPTSAPEPAPIKKEPRLILPKQIPTKQGSLFDDQPSAAKSPLHAMLDKMPWDAQKLPDENKNAKSHNRHVDRIKAMAYAGDLAGLEAFAAGSRSNTYGRKQNLLARTAIEAIKDTSPKLAEVDAAAHQAAASPHNDKPEPTEAQKDAGNYAKGSLRLHGLDISIENPRGSVRSGSDADGKKWSRTMSDHYGYIKRTVSADGDHVDVYVGPHVESERVFVVDQHKGGKAASGFDEHKVMLGYSSKDEAVAACRSNFEDGWEVGPVTEMSVSEFKGWLKDGDTKKPVAKPALGHSEELSVPGFSSFEAVPGKDGTITFHGTAKVDGAKYFSFVKVAMDGEKPKIGLGDYRFETMTGKPVRGKANPKLEYLMDVAKEHALAYASGGAPDADTGPREGERNADGLVFRDGRWHRDDEAAAQADIKEPPQAVKSAFATMLDKAKSISTANIEWTTSQRKNAEIAANMLNKIGIKATTENPSGRKTDNRFAAIGSPTNGILINPLSPFWKDPVASAKSNAEAGNLSTDNPIGVLLHEIAHTIFDPPGHWDVPSQKEVAAKVSKYAATNPKEFVSEAFAVVHTGKKFDDDVVSLLRRYTSQHLRHEGYKEDGYDWFPVLAKSQPQYAELLKAIQDNDDAFHRRVLVADVKEQITDAVYRGDDVTPLAVELARLMQPVGS